MTPIVAIAPLLLIYAATQDARAHLRLDRRLLPDPVEYDAGAASTDHNLLNLFDLYGAIALAEASSASSSPNALPYFLAGLRIAGGLALIGAVVAEFAAGTAGAGSGLAFRLLESQYRLNIPRLFAALVLLSLHRHR